RKPMSLVLETVEEMKTPQFVNSDVMQVTGRTAATLQTWINHGILIPTSGQNPGSGKRRLYSAIDVCKVAVLGELTDFGFPPSEARKLAEFVGDELTDNAQQLLTGRIMLWIYREGKEFRYDLRDSTFEMSPAEPTSLFIPVGMIVTLTLRGLRMILGGGVALHECEVVTDSDNGERK
ncbi:MAG: MerR family transcriptional regulator, partial [Bryobacteraceae bacterium]|nr:MerR family transcriptional regulator [Bryobacteraceae bacterium]